MISLFFHVPSFSYTCVRPHPLISKMPAILSEISTMHLYLSPIFLFVFVPWSLYFPSHLFFCSNLCGCSLDGCIPGILDLLITVSWVGFHYFSNPMSSSSIVLLAFHPPVASPNEDMFKSFISFIFQYICFLQRPGLAFLKILYM